MEHSENTDNKQLVKRELVDNLKKTHEIDKLQLYFSEPYVVNDNITITQPTIGDIVKHGEKSFYNTLYIFVLNPTSYRLQLWDMGIDWNKISDYELFCLLFKGIDSDIAKIFFGDIDFGGFDLYNKKLDDDTQVITLYNPQSNIEINEDTYTHISQYLRVMFNIFPKEEKTKGKTMKEWLIEEERDKLRAQKNNDSSKSTLLPMISSYLNHPGTKYKTKELRDIGIYEFMDSIQRLQIYESTIALMHGIYSGMIDGKSIDNEALNFMREK